MSKKRIWIDRIYQSAVYIASSFSILVLVFLFGFIFSKGKNNLNFEMLTQNYWSENLLIEFNEGGAQNFEAPTLKENQYFSSKYGVVLEDFVNHENQAQVIFSETVEGSPFETGYNASKGDGFEQALVPNDKDQIEKMILVNEDGSKVSTGMLYKHSAKDIVELMDNSAEIESLYYKTPGGGIWGSLKTTLILIGLSLSIALPIGIFTAIYLNELAKKNKITKLMEASIDLLAGVPSIIFGLMGVIVLYPITALFNIEGLSILLGSLTMSVILLPIIIRSVQESLKVVPDSLRMASLSLGATETQTIFKVVLPSAISGILTATLLAISRVIGESAALIYTMSTFVNDAPTYKTGGTSLAVHIWSLMSSDQPNFELASAISIIILLMVLVLNLSVKAISKTYQKKLGV